nr:phage tail protein [Szabonella alba]
MDRADSAVLRADDTSEPRYRTGLEVLAADEPASILEDLLTAANGDVAEVGGEWRIRLGEPEGPVHFFGDGDIVISKPQDLDPFPGLEQTHNAVTGTWPDPDSLWEAREAPPIHNPAWEEADGDLVWDEVLTDWIRRPRRLTAALTLNACPYGQQVQRVMRAFINDERRFAAHHITLGPEAAHVEPLDVICWTSARNGYDAKLFEVQEC